MKKFLYLILLIAFSQNLKAAPGDTTWVQAHYDKWLDWYGDFDTTIAFPNGTVTYRKIYMIFTLGKYVCPGSPQYCSDWDYTVQNYIMTPGGDTLELGRLITPYGKGPRMPANWKGEYIYDVTDFASVLKNTATVRLHYSGYSGGFTANIKFAFIEGTPERDVTGISRLWHGSFAYGNPSDPIASHFTDFNLTAPANTQSTEMKMNITGHGSDDNYCCEFMSHNYQVSLNGNQVANTAIWRADCGSNELYPQSGTWIYDRANWCPGASVKTNTHVLNVTGGANYNTGVSFDAYTGSGSYGSYTVEAAVFHYGAMNKTLDASIEQIIAPNNNEIFFRENHTCHSPTIVIRNSGSTNISSVSFEYGVEDSTLIPYTWNGNLNPRQEQTITLPPLASLKNLSLAGNTSTHSFIAKIITVNGQTDEDATNDIMHSMFSVAPTWPQKFVVAMKTNSEGTGGVGSGPSETSWTITDLSTNNVIASRSGAALNTVYLDTIAIPAPGCYKLEVTDLSCDGLHWWVWDQSPSSGVTAGYFNIKNYGSAVTIPLKGNTYTGTFNNDFGCGFVQYFTSNGTTGIPAIQSQPASMEIYPNPADEFFMVNLYGIKKPNGVLTITDAIGRSMFSQDINSLHTTINTNQLSPGVYTLIYTNIQTNEKIAARFVVSR